MEGINLALLPPLTIVEQVDYDALTVAYAQQAKIDDHSPANPSYRIALAGAYRDMLLRQDANEQAKGVMLAYAKAAQLDHIGVTYYKHPDGSPVVRLTGEKDDDYRLRLRQSTEGLSVAGPEGAYKFHCRSASPLVKDVEVTSPAPVEVNCYILSYDGSGEPTDELLATVATYLQPRRPFTDYVKVLPASVIEYQVEASLIVKQGPDPALVRQAAENAITRYVELKRQLGAKVGVSSIHAALTVEGVEDVQLTGWNDIVCTESQAPYCSNINVVIGGYL